MAELTADQHLERSSECLAEADALLGSKHPKGACNRAYYAVFNAAKVGAEHQPFLADRFD